MAQVKIDNRGGIVLFKVTEASAVKGKAPKVSYRTFPADKLDDPTAGKNFDTLHEARATMPPIPDTSTKTMSKADHALKLTSAPYKKAK